MWIIKSIGLMFLIGLACGGNEKRIFSKMFSLVLVKEEPNEFDLDNSPNHLDDDKDGVINVGNINT